jgi:hypothetical protein
MGLPVFSQPSLAVRSGGSSGVGLPVCDSSSGKVFGHCFDSGINTSLIRPAVELPKGCLGFGSLAS